MKAIYLYIFLQLAVVSVMAQQTTLASFRANQKNTAVELNWTALTEANMQMHYVERSSNGGDFQTIGNVVPQNATTPTKYEFVDAAPVQGPNYYRIRSLSRTGEVTLSGIARLNMGAIRTDIAVMPNPVRNGVVNLQLNNIDKGRYAITIVNAQGQRVYTYSLDHPGGSSTEIINLPGNVGKGTHFLQVTNGITRLNKQLLLQ
ncbi:T9SS type A sorting domain-containing protein [Aridibaculum aurantiacum]|uniref:T9SS type A sorting domain-containing protein n=1 Tax=Aridibaculum aurantiacum TaxID=2810307 RepID=UPI001A9598A8|nr:T9SS type A sorting domain-containing protein [Aridibaculum aurantiacum]